MIDEEQEHELTAIVILQDEKDEVRIEVIVILVEDNDEVQIELILILAHEHHEVIVVPVVENKKLFINILNRMHIFCNKNICIFTWFY